MLALIDLWIVFIRQEMLFSSFCWIQDIPFVWPFGCSPLDLYLPSVNEKLFSQFNLT